MSEDDRPVVTISAAYGAGGWLVAPRVADLLGVSYVDRAIPPSVAADLAVPIEEVTSIEDDLSQGFSRWLALFASSGAAWGGLPAPETDWCHDEESYKRHVRAVLDRAAKQGAVILGRGGAILLADHPRALHVRLDGPVERRIARAMDLGGLDEHTARRAQHETDTARQRYVHRLYHTNIADHRHYHLYLDVTAVPPATCVSLIVAAVWGREELWQIKHDSDAGTGLV
ncbi:MAG: cytidylate kinase-like family protein [Ferrimicrobium sp.]